MLMILEPSIVTSCVGGGKTVVVVGVLASCKFPSANVSEFMVSLVPHSCCDDVQGTYLCILATITIWSLVGGYSPFAFTNYQLSRDQ